MSLAAVLDRMNADPRKPGASTAAVCAVWREGGQSERIVEAVLGLEVSLERLVTVRDEAAIRARRAEMDAATAAVTAQEVAA